MVLLSLCCLSVLLPVGCLHAHGDSILDGDGSGGGDYSDVGEGSDGSLYVTLLPLPIACIVHSIYVPEKIFPRCSSNGRTA